LFGIWLGFFYLYPPFGWMIFHNVKHHLHINREGDVTLSWRYSRSRSAFAALTFVFVTRFSQIVELFAFLRRARQSKRVVYRYICRQSGALLVAHASSAI